MSDPVTHAEIEDVLSSIRRLVSEDSRGQPEAPEPAARLVLTPALRVQDPQPQDNGPAAAPNGTAEARPGPAASDPGRLQLQAGLADQAPAAADLASDADAPAAPSGALLAGEPEELLTEEPTIAFRHRATVYDNEGAKPDAPQGSVLQGGSQETSQPCAAAEQPQDATPWGDPSSTLFAAAADAGAQKNGVNGAAADSLADEAAATAGARAASVVRKIAELEARGATGQGGIQPHWEPDSQTEAPFAAIGADTIEWRDEPLKLGRAANSDAGLAPDGAAAADRARGEAHGAETAAAVAEAAVTGAALETLADSADSYIDEDSLRDLVASIVRQELQGPLGERITRNVRKLVRREIQRALAAHDLL